MLRISLILFACIGLSLSIVGMIYLLASEYMPYHAAALDTEWRDLGPNLQGLILGLLKGLGSGALVAGGAVLYMTAVSIRTNAQPFRLLLPIVSVGYSALLCYATYSVYVSTPGNPPLLPNLVLVAASLAASGMLLVHTPVKQGSG